MVTSSSSPIRSMGMRSKSLLVRDLVAAALERQRQRIGQIGLGDDALKLDSQMYDGLGDLRPNAADDALRAHQTKRGHRLQQMLSHQRIHRRYAGNVDDGHLGAGVDDLLQQ